MRVSVVADVHGNIEALARVAACADQVIVLGDLLDYVDYHDPTAGILGAMFGPERVEHFSRLRAAGDFAALRTYNLQLWDSIPDAAAVLSGLVRDRYRRIVDVIGPRALVILGNVDVAAEWEQVAGSVIPARDGEVVELEGVRFGFVGGGARRGAAPTVPTSQPASQPASQHAAPTLSATPWHPYLRTADEYRAAVERLGPVDVLCSHPPADIPALRYDVVPARLEMAGPGLVEYIDAHRPPMALSGHVHQPLARRARRGWTECINVGHFRRAEQAFELDLDAVRTTADAARARIDATTAAGR